MKGYIELTDAAVSSSKLENYIYDLQITKTESDFMSELNIMESPNTSVAHSANDRDSSPERAPNGPDAKGKGHAFESEKPLLSTTPQSTAAPVPPFVTYRPFSAQQFLLIVEEVKLAISQGIQPVRIKQGSSGSYFCLNRQHQIVGVFKPKNEEPYGQLNPKWTKWLHKTCCPCCFGRSCLMPNLGYISEAAASLVDRHLNLNVVPRTEVIELASPSFYYSYMDLRAARKNGGVLPPKIGSFQLFMHGYMDATKFLREGPQMVNDGRLPVDDKTGGLHHVVQAQFQFEFERLAVLDYIIRNTDRGLDNWMVRVEDSTTWSLNDFNTIADNQSPQADSGSPSALENHTPLQSPINTTPSIIHIAAIDNGLAFPFKHPDKWRSYPYGWSYLPAAKVPFSQSTRDKLLPLLTSKLWWDDLMKDLRQICKLDADFDEKLFRRQVAVMKGQVYNLVQVLRMGNGGALYISQNNPSVSSLTNQPTTARDTPTSQYSRASPTNPLLPTRNNEPSIAENPGAPYDLVLQPPCLVWEDEDVRDLVSGKFGVDFAGRDGVLATIIGGIDAVIHPDKNKHERPMTREEDVGSSSKKAKRSDAAPDGKFLTDLSENDENEPAETTKGSGKKGLRGNLDAFRGKVITFVKSQPWFSSW